ncbi:MAG: O-antigen ligase family protein [Pseudomonadota bacterium]
MAHNRLLGRVGGQTALLFWPLFLTLVLSFGLGTAAHRMMFYLMSPCLFIGLWYARTACIQVMKTPLFYGIAAYIGYFAISIAWSPAPAPYDIFRAGVDMACILVFLCALAVWLGQAAYRPDILRATVMGIAAVTLIYAGFYYGLEGHGISERLWGYGRYNNPIHLSAALALALLTWFATLERPLTRRMFSITAGVVSLLVIIILLSQTRSTLVAMSGAACVTIVLGYRRAGLAIIGSVAICMGLTYLAWGNSLAELVARGDTYRLAIWAEALDIIRQSPAIGHGLLFDPQFLLNKPTGPYEAVHNIILGHAVHGGLIAVLLMLGLGLRAGYVAIRVFLDTQNGDLQSTKDHKVALLSILLLGFGFIFSQFTSSHFVEGLNSQWLVFWMPVGLCLYLEMRRNEIRG